MNADAFKPGQTLSFLHPYRGHPNETKVSGIINGEVLAAPDDSVWIPVHVPKTNDNIMVNAANLDV